MPRAMPGLLVAVWCGWVGAPWFAAPPLHAQEAAEGAGADAPVLGTVDFPTSGGAEAQEHFLRGVLYMHSFEYEDARRFFRRAREVEPGFAMAAWGEAMTHNHPMWNRQDREAGRRALERLAPAPEARRALAPTEREKTWMGAVEVLFGEGSKPARDTAYAAAMRALSEAYPDDDEARAFYALSLLGLNRGVRDVATYMRAAAAADPIFRRNPEHPGAAHYLIHAFDDPVHAPLGLPAARAYSRIAPDAAHAQHMTTHIFVALGMWEEVVAQNELAAAASGPRDAWTAGHYTSWLHYGLLQQGRYREAEELMRTVLANRQEEAAGAPPRGYLASMLAFQALEAEAWDAAWVPREPPPGADTCLHADLLWTVGRAALETGRPEVAGQAAQRLEALEASVGRAEDAAPRAALSIMAAGLRAHLALLAGRQEEALALLRDAAALEERLPFEFGPPLVVQPPAELLGEVLLELGRAEAAVEAFQAALRLAPGRSRSLLGLWRAAASSERPRLADRARAELAENWRRADPGVAVRAGS